ncbi:hypothetical protein V5O48_005662 [Marasmius crinis-equi]|uniref:Indoleamine 2,3-dioxygenase n=1 Tax=Marasmius crinis-equi TaxID=585013 RepID=A0ABR3FLU4_9AGAR
MSFLHPLSRNYLMNVSSAIPPLQEVFRKAIVCLMSILPTLQPHQGPSIDTNRSKRDFDIDPATGFFPTQPLSRLYGAYKRWEDALTYALANVRLEQGSLEDAMSTEEWRFEIYNEWPVLGIEDLVSDMSKLQRAHLVLAWLVHIYVHTLPTTTEPKRVPASLAVPLVQVSQNLGIAPILTFADTVLWNWELINPEKPVTIDNMHFLHAFSGTQDELSFYRVSATAELHGVQILQIIDGYNKLPGGNLHDFISRISHDLGKLASHIEELSRIIQSVRASIDPHVFYWQIRPWLEGSDARGPEEPAWVYEGVEDSQELDLSGPSAGQSTVMHALDIFLDIDHDKRRSPNQPTPSPEENKRASPFMERMRRYMPGLHRQYLEHLQSSSHRSIRELAQSTPALRESYNTAVIALKKFRGLHIRVACLYIINMSRTSPVSAASCPASRMLANLDKRRAGSGPSRSTGGNKLSLLLKAGRDATKQAVL